MAEANTETTPLLSTDVSPAAISAIVPVSKDVPLDDDRPLPMGQIVLLCCARICEPIAYFSIFAFVQEQIHDMGVDEREVGFYTGMIESLFSLVQIFLMIPWGKAADRWGRKPCLVVPLIGVGVSQVFFGLSTKIWQLVVARCMAGFFAGTVVTVRTMFAEVSTPKTQARAFSYFAFAGNLGIGLGPVIGGFLSKPATTWPNTFGRFPLLVAYPYLLPCTTTGLLCILGATLNFFFMKETLKPGEAARLKAQGGSSIREILAAPGVAQILLTNMWLSLLGLGYTAVLPVFWFTPIRLGGFGWSPPQIARFLILGGFSQAIWLLFVFPWLSRKIRISGVLRFAAWGWVIMLPFFAVCNLLLRRDHVAVFWLVAATSTTFGSGVAMGYTAAQIAINNLTPSMAVLGTLNGIALSTQSGVRAIGPSVFASMYAAGVKSQYLNGEIIWVIMVVLALGLVVLLRWLPKAADGKAQPSEVDDTA